MISRDAWIQPFDSELDCPPGVRVWRFDLDSASHEDAWSTCLSDQERLRWSRFRFPVDARRYLNAHWGLRRVLAQVLDEAPVELTFGLGAQGKPMLRHPDAPSFNLTHCGGLAWLLVAPSGEWGIDAEIARPLPELHLLARSQLSPNEFSTWCGLSIDEQLPAFFCAWTRKEAALKALGSGLVTPACQLETGLSHMQARCDVRSPESGHQILLSAGCRVGDLHIALAECRPVTNHQGTGG